MKTKIGPELVMASKAETGTLVMAMKRITIIAEGEDKRTRGREDERERGEAKREEERRERREKKMRGGEGVEKWRRGGRGRGRRGKGGARRTEDEEGEGDDALEEGEALQGPERVESLAAEEEEDDGPGHTGEERVDVEEEGLVEGLYPVRQEREGCE